MVTPNAVEFGPPVTGVATSIGGTADRLNADHPNGAVVTSPHQTRRNHLVSDLPDDLDALLVTDLRNVRYLSGFTGSNGAVLVSRDRPALIATDGRYVTQVAAEAPELDCVEARPVAPGLVARASGLGIRRLGFESADVSVALWQSMTDAAAGDLELVPAGPLVEERRRVKDAGEVAALAEACRITDAAFAAVVSHLQAGTTERAIAWVLQQEIHAQGGDDLAFPSIVAFGANSAIPHHQPTDRELALGDLVKLDFGARYLGYHADITRTVVLGPAAAWQRELHDLVATVQLHCRQAVAVGVMPRALDTMAREEIEAAGHVVAHGLGHGVGLAIHELPLLASETDLHPLDERTVLTVEPGVYLPGRGGVRVEDTVVVRADGGEPLTRSPRELLEC
jgi:Xaa-Pro aminopeptidase